MWMRSRARGPTGCGRFGCRWSVRPGPKGGAGLPATGQLAPLSVRKECGGRARRAPSVVRRTGAGQQVCYSARIVYQDLRTQRGFAGSYETIASWPRLRKIGGRAVRPFVFSVTPKLC